VPLIVRFPAGKGPKGVRVAGLVDSRDIAPTIGEIFGLGGEPAARAFEGRSLLPMTLGAPGKPFVFSRSTGDKPRYSVRDLRYKLIFTSRFGPEELYDVPSDPEEKRNLVRKQPVLAAFYRQVLGEWMLGLKTGEIETTPSSALTKEQQENLKALGYVQ
jgi:arylsulfatase A-like enzyme